MGLFDKGKDILKDKFPDTLDKGRDLLKGKIGDTLDKGKDMFKDKLGDAIKDLGSMAKQAALDKVRDTLINPKLAGVGTVEKISFEDGKLKLLLRLDGIEKEIIEVTCSQIKIVDDGSSVSAGKFSSNKKFARTALERYLAGKDIAIPEGPARLAATTAKSILNI